MKKLILLTMLASSVMAAPSIIPQPVEMKETGGSFELTSDAVIAYADETARQPAELLATQLRSATGFNLPVVAGAKGDIVFQTLEDDSLGSEGYELRITSHVSIKAPSAPGLFYGAQTLRQLLPPATYSPEKVSKPWKIPAVEIRDVPRFGWRGTHLDVARHFMPKEDVLRFIDTMASLKLNTFHWHLTEDQGWRIEIKKYPKLTEVGAWRDETLVGHFRDKPHKYDGKRHGGFYTQDEIREVVAYAAERHITVVPEIDMPGHMQAAIAAYPELGCTTNKAIVKREWGISTTILSPEESSIEFCKEVLTEVMDLFPSKYIHIGGDEAKKDQWEASDRIQQLREERGLKDMHEMQSWFIKQLDDFLVEHGRRLIGWDEIAEGGLAENAVVMWWRGKYGYDRGEIPKKAARDGHDVINASNSHLYFDYYQSEDEAKEPLAIGGFLPLGKVYGYDPIIPGLDEQAASHIMGAQGQLWTEYMPDMEAVEYMAFPRVCALAELVWLPGGQKDYAGFLGRMKVQEKRFDAAGVNHRKIDFEKPFELEVVCYNVLGIPTKGYESWEKRKKDVVNALLADAPDIIGTQEMRYRNIPDYLNQRLAPAGYASFPETTLGLPTHEDEHGAVLRGQPLEGRHWQNWFYYKTWKFEKIAGGQIPLREAKEVPWPGERSINWMALRDKVSGLEFVVMNTHWQPGPKRQGQREIEAAHMREFIESFPKDIPIIAMGDFNAHPGTPEMTALVGDGLMADAIVREKHIDHILQRNFTVLPGSEKYEHKKRGKMMISDHPMLTVKLALPVD